MYCFDIVHVQIQKARHRSLIKIALRKRYELILLAPTWFVRFWIQYNLLNMPLKK